jgi:glycosyltransferase involved in cell wall biosynthesis
MAVFRQAVLCTIEFFTPEQGAALVTSHHFISVVIPTRNRQSHLERLLKELTAQSLPFHFWETVIVNNASSDNTQNVLENWKGQLPNLKGVEEIRSGSNYARNKGLKTASGDLIAFLDDDTLPHPQWLERIFERYLTLNPLTDCLGGKVELAFHSPLPRWYGPFLQNYLSYTHLGPSFMSVAARTLCSANLVLPASLLKDINGFDERINRKTGNLRSNDETLTLLKLEALGARFFYDPAIKVFHQISTDRLTQGYFRRRAWWQGRSDAEMELYLSGKNTVFHQVIWPNLYHILRNPSLIWMAFRPCRGPGKFKLALQGQLLLGRIWGGVLALLHIGNKTSLKPESF